MEEKSTEELVERIDYLTKQLEEDLQRGGTGQREREKREILQAIEEHQERLKDLCKMEAEREDAQEEFSRIEAELRKRRRISEEELEKEAQEAAQIVFITESIAFSIFEYDMHNTKLT